MAERLDLPLFELRRFVVLNDEVMVGTSRYDYHLDIIIRITEGRYSFVGDKQKMVENQKILRAMVERGERVDMGMITRVNCTGSSNTMEINGQSEGFLYPPYDDTLISSQNRQNTLRIFQEKYPVERFVLTESH
jgi:hypothetical protein